MEIVEIKAEKYIKHENHKLYIRFDDTAENPLDLNDLNFLSAHERYCSCGEGKLYKDMPIKEALKRLKEEGYRIKPIYAYIHSGITLYCDYNGSNCPFDSGLFGFIFDKVKDYDDSMIKNIVRRWQCYLNGEVYYLEVVNADTNESEDVFGDLYDTDDVWYLLKRYFGIKLESPEIMKLIEY